MTLVLAAHGRNTLWVLADRRLSKGGEPVSDDSIKLTTLEAKDGWGILSYAGLGKTVRGTEPSEWMSAVLRGRGGLTFEHALRHLSNVANREIGPHLKWIGEHHVIVPAFVGGRTRLYSIDNIVDEVSGRHAYRYASHQHTTDPNSPSVSMAIGGSGAAYLDGLHRRGDRWARSLRSLLKKHDQGRIRDDVVADHLAALNLRVHKAVDTVGPRCIVMWRHATKGGAHRAYSGIDRENSVPPIPAIANGIDVQAVAGVILTELKRVGFSPGHLGEINTERVNEELQRLPGTDERLR